MAGKKVLADAGARSRIEPTWIESVSAYLIARLNQRQRLRGELDLGIAFGTPKLHPARQRRTGPARGQLRDATAAKAQSGVGNIFVAPEAAHTDRLDALHRGLHQREQQVEIVNHQVQYDANIR